MRAGIQTAARTFIAVMAAVLVLQIEAQSPQYLNSPDSPLQITLLDQSALSLVNVGPEAIETFTLSCVAIDGEALTVKEEVYSSGSVLLPGESFELTAAPDTTLKAFEACSKDQSLTAVSAVTFRDGDWWLFPDSEERHFSGGMKILITNNLEWTLPPEGFNQTYHYANGGLLILGANAAVATVTGELHRDRASGEINLCVPCGTNTNVGTILWEEGSIFRVHLQRGRRTLGVPPGSPARWSEEWSVKDGLGEIKTEKGRTYKPLSRIGNKDDLRNLLKDSYENPD